MTDTPHIFTSWEAIAVQRGDSILGAFEACEGINDF
jgi:hypothetical protein